MEDPSVIDTPDDRTPAEPPHHQASILLTMLVPEIVNGTKVELSDLPTHIRLKDPTHGAILWALFMEMNRQGAITDGGPITVGWEV